MIAKKRPARTPRVTRRAERNASTAVTITRPELEAWLDSLGFPWSQDPRYPSAFLVRIRPNVAVKVTSTLTGAGTTAGTGEGTMHLALVSTPPPPAVGRVINKKAEGQKGFHRVKGWRDNWTKGVERMRAEYEDKREFYDRIASADPAANARAIASIEAIPGWRNDPVLVHIHGRASKGEALAQKSFDEIAKRAPRERPVPPPAREAPGPVRTAPAREYDPRDGRVVALREVYRIARDVARDERTQKFIRLLADQLRDGVATTDGQLRAVRALVDEYGVPFAYPSDDEYNAAMGAPQRRAATNGRRARVAAKARPRKVRR